MGFGSDGKGECLRPPTNLLKQRPNMPLVRWMCRYIKGGRAHRQGGAIAGSGGRNG
jgi:hypothetical protein